MGVLGTVVTVLVVMAGVWLTKQALAIIWEYR